MAAGKTTGLADQLLVGGFNLSGDIGSLARVHGGPQKTQDMTGVDKLAHERLGLLRDGGLGFSAFFNPTAPSAHSVLAPLPTADVLATYNRGGAAGASAQGNAAACCVAKQANYDPTRGNDGSLHIVVDLFANGFGLEWGIQVDGGLRSDVTATTPATGADMTVVSTAFGWQAYLQVTALTGTNVIVTLQDSADNAAFANLTGAAFTSVTAVPATQRLTSPGATDTVRRYVRAVTTGTFTLATFSVVFVRNQTAVVF